MVNSQNLTKILTSFSATVLMIGCSTSIAERSPFDIASSSLRRTDSFSGVSEVVAPEIKAFSSSRSSVKGQMLLRTAGPFTDEKGVVHQDGAYLDILMNYATATPNPDGGLFFDQAVWPGGAVAELADFGASVLDCREDVREIYRLPIGYTGYGRYGGHYGQYGRRHGGYGSGRVGRRGGHRGTGHYGGRTRHGGGNNDHDGTRSDNNHRIDDATNTDTSRNGSRQVNGGDRLRPSKGPYRSIAGSRIKERMSRAALPASAHSNTPKSVQSSVSRPSPRSTPSTAPARTSRTTSSPPPKRASRPTRNTSRATDRAFKNTNNKRTRSRKSVDPTLKYHPENRYNPGYTDYVVNYSCERQESLRIFIPRERLIAGEKNGILLYLRPQNGLEETIALPPNYVSGFLMAAYSSEGVAHSTDLPAPAPEPSARTPIIYGGN